MYAPPRRATKPCVEFGTKAALIAKRSGDEGSVREELLAELGTAFLAADLASHIASWIIILQNDSGAIVQAATHAERAATYLHQQACPDKLREAAYLPLSEAAPNGAASSFDLVAVDLGTSRHRQ